MEIEDITFSPEKNKEWDEFVERSPGGTIYHSSHWKSLYNALAIPQQRMRIICCRHNVDGKIIGGCTFLEKERYGFRLAVNAIATQYAGFLLPPATGEKISDTITQHHRILSEIASYLSRRYHNVHLFCGPGLTDFRPLQQKGWLITPAYTYFLSLDDIEKLWQQFDGSVRRQIKKGENQGLQLCHTFNATSFVRLIDETFRRHHQRNPIPDGLVRLVIEDESFVDKRVLIGAEDKDGNLASGVIVLRDSKRAYYAFSATRTDVMGTGVHSWLLWEMFKHLNQQGIHQFDFLGGNIPSIARFKEKFNPELGIYFSTLHFGSYVLKALKWIRSLLKH